MTKSRPEEVWAADCLRLAMPGVEVRFHDDNSQPLMHDLDFLQNGTRFGICEVTSTTDKLFTESWNRLNGSNQVMTVEHLTQNWLVEIVPDRKERRLRAELPVILGLIEGSGIRTQRNLMHVRGLPKRDHLMDLGIISLYSAQTTTSGGRIIFMVFPGNDRLGGAVPSTGNDLVNWLSDWLAEPTLGDNSEKLRKVASEQRHIFIIFPGISLAPFSVTDVLCRDDGPLPTIDPRLPKGITHIWAVSTWSSGSVFGWSALQGWQRTPKPMAMARTAQSLEPGDG